MNKVLTFAFSAVLLSGCSAIKQGQLYYADTMPTAASVQAAGGSQVFNGSLYLGGDFNADGSPRTFAQYDFVTESAPCTVLGESKGQGYYSMVKDGQELTFECRSRRNGSMSPEARLFLIGSSIDCESKGGTTPTVTAFGLKQNLKCNGYRINRDKLTQVDLAFKG